jgi:hypothetical protein
MSILILKICGEAKKQLLELQERDLTTVFGDSQEHIEYPGKTESLHLTLGTMVCTPQKYKEMLDKLIVSLNQTIFPPVITFLEQGEEVKFKWSKASILSIEQSGNLAIKSFAENFNTQLGNKEKDIEPLRIFDPFKAHVSLAYDRGGEIEGSMPTVNNRSIIKTKMGNLVLEDRGEILALIIKTHTGYQVSEAFQEYKNKIDKLKLHLSDNNYLKTYLTRIQEQFDNELVDITEDQLIAINRQLDLRLASLHNPSMKTALQQVERFREAAKSLFNIGNTYKADLIESALLSADPNRNVIDNNEVKQALGYHRIFSFFGTKTAKSLELVASEERHSLLNII